MSKNKGTKGQDYVESLTNRSGARWKKVLDVQRPYRWNLRRLETGKTLDVGCGIGRNIGTLSKDSVGIDHNPHAVEVVKKAGFNAVTTDEFMKNKKKYKKGSFDSILLAHVLEHCTTAECKDIIRQYLPYITDKVVVICPQEIGFKTDDTHINFLEHDDIEKILEDCGLTITKSYSFPFPRKVGKVFTYNETIVVAEKNQT